VSNRQAAIELLFGNTSELEQKRSNAPATLPHDEYLAREHSFHRRRLWAAERLYDRTLTSNRLMAVVEYATGGHGRSSGIKGPVLTQDC
jgi:DNA-binding transcriptional LysR family regulator